MLIRSLVTRTPSQKDKIAFKYSPTGLYANTPPFKDFEALLKEISARRNFTLQRVQRRRGKKKFQKSRECHASLTMMSPWRSSPLPPYRACSHVHWGFASSPRILDHNRESLQPLSCQATYLSVFRCRLFSSINHIHLFTTEAQKKCHGNELNWIEQNRASGKKARYDEKHGNSTWFLTLKF